MNIILDIARMSRADFALDGDCGPLSLMWVRVCSSLSRTPEPRKFSRSSNPGETWILPEAAGEGDTSSIEVRDIMVFVVLVREVQ
jgi:hypothetical protein